MSPAPYRFRSPKNDRRDVCGLLEPRWHCAIVGGDVAFRQATTNVQLAMLARGELDLGLVAPPFAVSARLNVTDIAQEPVVVAAHETLASGKSDISLAAIGDRLVMFPRVEGPALYGAILAMFGARGLTPTFVQESPRMMTTLALVAANRGAAFVPAAEARCVSVRGVAFRPLHGGHGLPAWPLAFTDMPLSVGSAIARLLALWRQQASVRRSAGAVGCRAPAKALRSLNSIVLLDQRCALRSASIRGTSRRSTTTPCG